MKCHGVFGALLLLSLVMLVLLVSAAGVDVPSSSPTSPSTSEYLHRVGPGAGWAPDSTPTLVVGHRHPRAAAAAGFSPLQPVRHQRRGRGDGAGRRGGRYGNGGGQWCASEDPGARAFLASTVFEGKARSVGPASAPGAAYSVTFVVQRVYKDSSMLRVHSQVRLQFPAPRPTPIPGAPAPARRRRPGGGGGRSNNPCRTTQPPVSVRRGGKFLVFAERLGAHNLTARGPPLPRSRAAVLAIRAALCHNCARPPSVWGLRDASVAAEGRLRLLCRTEGSPAPAVTWYKDGRRVHGSRRVRLRHNRKKSALVITRARPSDSGRYECRAVSAMGSSGTAAATLTVRQSNTTALWPLLGRPCFLDAYCLNGGTCTYYETVGELVCQCADGYKGQRCESKDVSSRGSLSYLCKLGISASYYC